jgi:excisionase family DNA binding protein
MGELNIEKLVGREEISKIFGISIETVDRLTKDSGLPYYKLGRFTKFRVSEIERWLKERRHVGA